MLARRHSRCGDRGDGASHHRFEHPVERRRPRALRSAELPSAPRLSPRGRGRETRAFQRRALDHFIFLERPESVAVEDGAGFEPSGICARAMKADRLMSAVMDYATVGQLYASIEDGLKLLSEELGQEQLFLGDTTHQIGPNVVALRNGPSCLFGQPLRVTIGSAHPALRIGHRWSESRAPR